MQHQTEDVVLVLCCTEEDCARLTAHLREQTLVNEVHSVRHGHELVGVIERVSSGSNRAFVILDASAEDAWPGFDAVRGSHLRAVPIVAICEPEESSPAYERGVNAVVTREQWHNDFGRTAARLVSFWLQVAELPQLPTRSEVETYA